MAILNLILVCDSTGVTSSNIVSFATFLVAFAASGFSSWLHKVCVQIFNLRCLESQWYLGQDYINIHRLHKIRFHLSNSIGKRRDNHTRHHHDMDSECFLLFG